MVILFSFKFKLTNLLFGFLIYKDRYIVDKSHKLLFDKFNLVKLGIFLHILSTPSLVMILFEIFNSLI